MNIFNKLPKKHFVLSEDNRGQLYKEAINFLYDENLKMQERINDLEETMYKLVIFQIFTLFNIKGL